MFGLLVFIGVYILGRKDDCGGFAWSMDDDHSSFYFFWRTVLAGLPGVYISLGEVYCGTCSGLSLYLFGILQVIGS